MGILRRRVVSSLTCLTLLAGCHDDVPIARDVSAEQVSQITAALHASGISSVTEGSQVSVSRDEVPHAVRVLSASALPHPDVSGFQSQFGEPSVFPSTTELEARRQHVLEHELALSLSHMPGVLDARVHVAFPPEPSLDQEPASPTATVLLRSRGASSVPTTEVQTFVAAAVPNLRASSVNVISVALPAPPVVHALTNVGVFDVTTRSASGLRAFIIFMIVMGVLMLIAIAYLATRLHALKRELSRKV